MQLHYTKAEECEIVSLGIQEIDVYDLEIEDNHNFFANDILVHNTDSIFITLDKLVKALKIDDTTKAIDFLDKVCKQRLEPFIAKQFQELAEYLNVYENKMHMKREKLADAGIWRAKKNYIIQVHDDEGVRLATPKIKTVGVETTRSSSPELVKKALRDCYSFLLNDDLKSLREYEKQFREKYMSASLDEIAFPRGISDIEKWAEGQYNWRTGAPIHVKAAITFNKLLQQYGLQREYQTIKNGDKIKFVYLKEPNPTRNNAIAFMTVVPEEFGLEPYWDKELQYNKTFIEPLKSFLGLLNWELKQVNRLEDMWSDETVELSSPVQKVEEPKVKRDPIPSKPKISKPINKKAKVTQSCLF
jgi:DNA polymerase elongation subunit (family B)